jgi:hypothetical protein
MEKAHDCLRRQAIQITSQLPDNTADALTVLNYARDLVMNFLYQPTKAADQSPENNVTVFPASTNSR